MGGLFKKSGGGKTTSTENKTQTQESWLQRNPQYQALENAALGEASNFNMPQYQVAGENDYIKAGVEGITRGIDTSRYDSASDYFTNHGQALYDSGTSSLQNYQSVIDRIGGMGQSDYQEMMQNEYNSSLVNDQIKQASEDINTQYLGQVQQLNEAAAMTGNMGNSRAGVAQGVMAGQAQKAVGAASVQYRTNEENAAMQRVQMYLGNTMQAAQAGASIAQQQQGVGLNMYSQGMGYLAQSQQLQQQNYSNLFNIGQYQQQREQSLLDVQRQNQIMQQSPALTRLAYFNQTFLPMASLSQYGTSQGTTVTQTPATGGSLFGGILGAAGSMAGSYFGARFGMKDEGARLGGAIGGGVGNSF